MKHVSNVLSVVLPVTLLLSAVTVFASGTDEQPDDDVITLKVYAYLDRTDKGDSMSFDKIVAAFEEQYPDINLEFDYLTGNPYHNKLQAMNASDQLPDLMTLWPGKRTGNVTGSGKIKDLRPWIDQYRDDFKAEALTPQGPNGEIFELPEKITATHIMYTNTGLLEELGLSYPETLDELIAQGEVIRAAGYIPIAMDNKDGWQMQSTLLSALVERTGGKAWLEDARVGKASFSDPEFVQALSVIETLHDQGLFSPGMNQAEYGRALSDFVNQRAVYFIDGEWRTTNLELESSPELREAIVYNVFPRLPNERGQQNSTAIVPGSGYGMNANLEGSKAEAAWKWIWFYAGPEGSGIKANEGVVPAYVMDLPASAPVLTKKLSHFLRDTSGGYVLDDRMDGEGMGLLNTGLQEMMLGTLTPQELGDKYEAWVAENDSGRGN